MGAECVVYISVCVSVSDIFELVACLGFGWLLGGWCTGMVQWRIMSGQGSIY